MSDDVPGPRPQRSTPIPGADQPAAPSRRSTVIDGWGSSAQTPTEFASGRTPPSVPAPPFPSQPFAGQPFPGQPFPGQPLPGHSFPGQQFPGQQFPGQEFLGQQFPGQLPPTGVRVRLGAQPTAAARGGRSVLGILLVLLVIAGPVIGLGIGVWAFFQARDAVHQAEDLTDPNLSNGDRAALGLGPDVHTLYDAGAAPALVAAFAARIGGSPTQFTRVLLYPDYAFADAQDPLTPTHVDEYDWRTGSVGSPDPQPNRDDLASALFASTDVNWNVIAGLAAAAPSLLTVEQGAVSHVDVERDDDTAAGAVSVVIRIYVTGPRSSGYLEADALTGQVLATH